MPRTVAVIIALSALVPNVAIAQDAEALKAELARLQQENAALRQENAALQAQLKARGAEKAQAEAQRRQLAAHAEQMEQTVTQLTRQKQALEQEVVQEQQRARRLYTASDYNASTNTTTVASRLTTIEFERGVQGDWWIGVEFDHPGKTVTQPVDQATVRIQSVFSTGEYRTAKTATVNADGQVTTHRISNYEAQARNVGGIRNRRKVAEEAFDIALPAAAIDQIANAAAVTITFGRARAQLTTDQIQAFGAIAEQMRPGD